MPERYDLKFPYFKGLGMSFGRGDPNKRRVRRLQVIGLPDKPCLRCGKAYTPKYEDQLFCGGHCRLHSIDRDRLVFLYETGASWKEIIDELRLGGYHYARKLLRKLGVPRRPDGWKLRHLRGNGVLEHNAYELKPTDEVRLVTPDIPRLNGALAQVVKLEDWGAHVSTRAAATGRFRAHWSEMQPIDKTELINPDGAFLSFNVNGQTTGKACPECGNLMVRRGGPCEVCPICGRQEGCS